MHFLNDIIGLYVLDNDYVEYLYNQDDAVYYHAAYREKIKPYFGILIAMNEIKYFIPLTSPKEKHIHQKIKTRDFLMMYEKVDKTISEPGAIYKDITQNDKEKYHILGVLEIEKMIPVPENKYKKIPFDQLDLNYQFLFFKEHEFCKSKQDIIKNNATKIYNKTKQKGKRLSKFHCDYIKLEEAMNEYLKS
ncbi:hypothetical protein AYO51_16110 [Lactiplantibacillus plantarum]|uniref:type III toxin-antitoxin system ToxN/AbiQ family toxin n=1 Tax=Lactiplantibacillus plantarum TaxID=1590 RepID=UPI00078978A9|nr:type III toxin-antitoxin system ToxN/AbiQ family toxin [Lactiplantibacillus plantarum]KYK53055.1 hypothetical protein AYO51_16110 [Lactiplantibacillus plantarum]KYM70393.1 hypothetical protein AZJ01_11210 [Lactiplantibacillus plantarum]KYM70425.1 hypothetical protein AZJ01_11380 [Lactiplantibacillus plantarum]